MKKEGRFSIYSLLMLGVFIILANGCQNDEPIVHVPADLTGSWTLSQSVINTFTASGDRFYDVFMLYYWVSREEAIAYEKEIIASLEPGVIPELGSAITLKSDYSYESNFWGSPAGDWSLGGDRKILTLRGKQLAPSNVDLEIVSLTSSTLIIRLVQYVDEGVWVAPEGPLKVEVSIIMNR